MGKIKEILEFVLLDINDYKLTVYHLLALVVIFIVTLLVLMLIKRVLKRQQKKDKIDTGKAYAIYQISKYFIIVIAVAIGLENIGIHMKFLLASSAALLVGLGLGIQHLFNDIISGFIILFGATIKVGDVVEVNGVVGKVTEIGFRRSMIVTRDDIDMIIPNSKFVMDNVVNWSYSVHLTRFELSVGVAYGSDTRLVERILQEVADEHNKVSKTPKPFVRFKDFGNSSLDFKLFFWSDDIFRIENVKSDLRFRIDDKFRENNITIPFPQRDVWMRNSGE